MLGEVQEDWGGYEPREWFGRCDWCCEERLFAVRLLAFNLCCDCAPAMEEHEERYFVGPGSTVTVIRSRRPSTADFMKWLARRKRLLLAGWRIGTPTPTPAERGF